MTSVAKPDETKRRCLLCGTPNVLYKRSIGTPRMTGKLEDRTQNRDWTLLREREARRQSSWSMLDPGIMLFSQWAGVTMELARLVERCSNAR